MCMCLCLLCYFIHFYEDICKDFIIHYHKRRYYFYQPHRKKKNWSREKEKALYIMLTLCSLFLYSTYVFLWSKENVMIPKHKGYFPMAKNLAIFPKHGKISSSITHLDSWKRKWYFSNSTIQKCFISYKIMTVKWSKEHLMKGKEKDCPNCQTKFHLHKSSVANQSVHSVPI